MGTESNMRGWKAVVRVGRNHQKGVSVGGLFVSDEVILKSRSLT